MNKVIKAIFIFAGGYFILQAVPANAQFVTPGINPQFVIQTSSALVSSNRHPLLISGVPFSGLFNQLVQKDVTIDQSENLIPAAYNPYLSVFFLSAGISPEQINTINLIGTNTIDGTSYNRGKYMLKFNFNNIYFQGFGEFENIFFNTKTTNTPFSKQTNTGLNLAYLYKDYTLGLGVLNNRLISDDNNAAEVVSIDNVLEASVTARFANYFFGTLRYKDFTNQADNKLENSWSEEGFGAAAEIPLETFNLIKYEFFFKRSASEIAPPSGNLGVNVHQSETLQSHTLEFQVNNFVISYNKRIGKTSQANYGDQTFHDHALWADQIILTFSAVDNFSKTSLEFESALHRDSDNVSYLVQKYGISQGFVF